MKNTILKIFAGLLCISLAHINVHAQSSPGITNFSVSQIHSPSKAVVDELLIEFEVNDLEAFNGFRLRLIDDSGTEAAVELDYEVVQEDGSYFLYDGTSKHPLLPEKRFFVVQVRDQLSEPYRIFTFSGITRQGMQTGEHTFEIAY